MNLLKLLTKSGRQKLVATEAKAYLTPDKFADLVADGVVKCIEAGADKMTDDRVAQIANGCTIGGNALAHIASAVNPTSEDGKKVSAKEKALIRTDIKSALSSLITQTAIDGAVDSVVQYIP